MFKKINLATYSSLKIGPIVDVFIINEIEKIENTYIIGGCNNLLFSNNPPPLAMLGCEFDFIHIKDGRLHVGAATPSGKILSFAKKNNLADFEWMQKLPGTLGGMLKMNAGLKKWEICNTLLAIKTANGWVKKEDIAYAYRYTNIAETVFEATFAIKEGFDYDALALFKKMRENQPQQPSAGSCFKNPPNAFAAKLLQDAQLKGYRLGNMAFSEKHANFLVNLGGGSYEEARKIIDIAKERVFAQSGIKLELEIRIIDTISD
ncbi:MAG: UDP-N-acetylmuramate dehydrogenase [Sulfurospirillum sp.]|nr:UDP-N-acetylmuramate dehydrogenase [Sulfurospirillum sp.]